jgi:hypothetical protein
LTDLFTLVLTQDRDNATGTVDLTDIPGPVTGTIRGGGELPLSGDFTVVIEGFPVEVSLSDFEIQSTDNARLTGRFRTRFRQSALQGSATFDSELRSVSKTGPSVSEPQDRVARILTTALRRLRRSSE